MTVKIDIHAQLRQATAPAHERLHHHAGFGAAAAGTISLQNYRLLLERLWGFHHSFESMLKASASLLQDAPIDLSKRGRSPLLERDLMTLGLDHAAIQKLPQCTWPQTPATRAELMGSLYVVEGSTLGGVHIARALKPLFPPDTEDGRRFFLGYGEDHGAMWRDFLAQLEDCVRSETDEADAVRGACQTFEDFENWFSAWNEPAKAAM